jgi:hypothetical protein
MNAHEPSGLEQAGWILLSAAAAVLGAAWAAASIVVSAGQLYAGFDSKAEEISITVFGAAGFLGGAWTLVLALRAIRGTKGRPISHIYGQAALLGTLLFLWLAALVMIGASRW